MPLNPTIARVTERIIQRSEQTRGAYLERMKSLGEQGPRRAHLSCGNSGARLCGNGFGSKRTHCTTTA